MVKINRYQRAKIREIIQPFPGSSPSKLADIVKDNWFFKIRDIPKEDIYKYICNARRRGKKAEEREYRLLVWESYNQEEEDIPIINYKEK